MLRVGHVTRGIWRIYCGQIESSLSTERLDWQETNIFSTNDGEDLPKYLVPNPYIVTFCHDHQIQAQICRNSSF